MIESILDGVLAGKELAFEEAMVLLSVEGDDLDPLTEAANTIRKRFCGNKIDLCSLINAKSGLCSEDCKFCAQSLRYKTNCETYPLVSVEKIVSAARNAKENGATNFCIVISGKGPTSKEFEKIKEAIRRIKKEVGIKIDCSLGGVTKAMIEDLKKMGIDRYNHNLETSENFYKNICRSHHFNDRLNTVRMLKDLGVEPCCGGIIGLGEAPEERLNLAFLLKELDIRCIPINILNPRKGTPLESVSRLEPLDIIKTVAVFRLILPRSVIKIASGREDALGNMQEKAFASGANGMIIGGYLTTAGQSVEDDLQMVKDLGFELK